MPRTAYAQYTTSLKNTNKVPCILKAITDNAGYTTAIIGGGGKTNFVLPCRVSLSKCPGILFQASVQVQSRPTFILIYKALHAADNLISHHFPKKKKKKNCQQAGSAKRWRLRGPCRSLWSDASSRLHKKGRQLAWQQTRTLHTDKPLLNIQHTRH